MSILVRGHEDHFTFSVDASGERLHRRGARVEIGAAPLRETLAAGLLALAGWDPSVPLVDPMCGAGTIVIEAALQALDRAPGIDRAFGDGFAIDGWPLFSAGSASTEAAALRDEARGRIRAALPAPIVGSDHDARAIESAQRNADRAEVGAALTLASRDITDARPPGPNPGLVIANPPTADACPIRGRRSAPTVSSAACCARTSGAGAPRSSFRNSCGMRRAR